MPVVEKEVKLSATKTVLLKPVSMLEQMTADVYASALAAKVNATATGKLELKAQAVCSIRAINGTPVQPLVNYMQFQAVATDITGEEAYELINAFIDAAGLGKDDEAQAGNESAETSPVD